MELVVLLVLALACVTSGGPPPKKKPADWILIGHKRCPKRTADNYNAKNFAGSGPTTTQLGAGVLLTETWPWWEKHPTADPLSYQYVHVLNDGELRADEIHGYNENDSTEKFIHLALIKHEDGRETHVMVIPAQFVARKRPILELRAICARRREQLSVLPPEPPDIADPNATPTGKAIDYKSIPVDPDFARPHSLDSQTPRVQKPRLDPATGLPVGVTGRPKRKPAAEVAESQSLLPPKKRPVAAESGTQSSLPSDERSAASGSGSQSALPNQRPAPEEAETQSSLPPKKRHRPNVQGQPSPQNPATGGPVIPATEAPTAS